MMPRCFFDIDERGRVLRDAEGRSLPGVQAEKDEARSALCELARGFARGCDAQAMSATVRDEALRCRAQIIRRTLLGLSASKGSPRKAGSLSEDRPEDVPILCE